MIIKLSLYSVAVEGSKRAAGLLDADNKYPGQGVKASLSIESLPGMIEDWLSDAYGTNPILDTHLIMSVMNMLSDCVNTLDRIGRSIEKETTFVVLRKDWQGKSPPYKSTRIKLSDYMKQKPEPQ